MDQAHQKVADLKPPVVRVDVWIRIVPSNGIDGAHEGGTGVGVKVQHDPNRGSADGPSQAVQQVGFHIFAPAGRHRTVQIQQHAVRSEGSNFFDELGC